MSIKRREHWATRELKQFLIDKKNARFEWGVCDCCLIAADAILAITGTDVADDFRGKYHDEASAFALIRQVAGGTTVADAAAYCALKHGLQEWKTPLLAKRGDLVVIQDEEQLIAGFVHLNGTHAVSIGSPGLRFFPLSQVTRAWKV